jgi:hypothetical protein
VCTPWNDCVADMYHDVKNTCGMYRARMVWQLKHTVTAARAKALGCQRRQLLGPFEAEEEGICVASDVVKVKVEDPATPGSLRWDRVRWYVGDPFRGCVLLGPPLRKHRDRKRFPNIGLIKTKQHTSTVQAGKERQRQLRLPTTQSGGTCMTACTLHKSQKASSNLSRLTKKVT